MLDTYGQRLEEALRLSGRERKELAAEIGVSVQAIGQVILGGTKALSAENSVKAARFLGVDHYWLATGEGSPKQRSGWVWPFPGLDEEKVMSLSRDDRIRLEAAICLAAAQLGLDIKKDKSEESRVA